MINWGQKGVEYNMMPERSSKNIITANVKEEGQKSDKCNITHKGERHTNTYNDRGRQGTQGMGLMQHDAGEG